jgi:outer membrane protein TolC
MGELKDPRKQRGAAWKKTAAVLFLMTPMAAVAQVSLSTAVDLAEKSSPAVRSAQANLLKAGAALTETKDAYIPTFNAGASPGYAYGYPLGEPAFFNATSQSLVVSFSQPDYIRAARAGVNSARLSLKNTQQQVALDVALAYVQLDHDLREIAALEQEKDYADALTEMEQQRVAAGVDATMDSLRAQLTAAQVEERRIHLENDANDMRLKLSHLAGVPATGLNTVSTSIPPPPPLPPASGIDETLPTSDPGVAAAYATAKSKFYTSFGDARQNYRPIITFGAQYALFQKFAGYTEYFRGFQYNNLALGVQVTFPIFNASTRARARESAAEAVLAQADADAARNTLSEQTQTMRGTVRELAAQQRVAQLENQLAQAQLKTIDTELANGTGSATAPPVSPIQAQQAHIQERERYEDSLDANFNLMKVELNLLRVTGQIDSWLQSSLSVPNAPMPTVTPKSLP